VGGGTSVPVNGATMPATLTSGTGVAVGTSGVIPSELGTDPYVGLFDLRTRTLTVNFDVTPISVIPEPATAFGGLLCLAVTISRRRRE